MLPAEIREEILQNERVREQNMGRNNISNQFNQNRQDDSDIAILIASVQDPIVR